ncbi:MAG: 23S rRNA (adenine(2503)-C(2))-methyltransferase RlmN [Gemmatimonadota bacterium]
MISTAQGPDLAGLAPEAAESRLREHFADREQPAYRATQVLSWIYERLVTSFDDMTNLPREERAALAEFFDLTLLATERVSRSVDGTAKHLWRLADGGLIESVLIPTSNRLTLCISSQAGCAMACTFCATGWMGYDRQLSAGEIVAQYRQARIWAEENDYGDITNIVFMGMGEPLMNPKAVFPTLEVLNRGYGVGARRITISTVGVVPGIQRLADMPEQYGLAVSLHAPTSDLRRQLIPLEKKYPLPRLMEALREFDAAGGKRITFEYVMIDGINDSVDIADELADLIGEFKAFVNLIPFNPIPANDWRPTPPDQLSAFAARLERRGVSAFVRTPRGRDIAAACGQLKAEATEGRSLVQLERQGVGNRE